MDDRLTALVKGAQQLSSEPEKQRILLFQLVDEILRSRKVGRAPKGQSLSGVYYNLFVLVQRQLQEDIGDAISSCNLQRISTREWVLALQNQAFRKVLDDDQLKQLALEAQRQPPHTEFRTHALTQLIEAIRLSGRLVRPHKGMFNPQLYDLLYEEAVNQTLVYVCRKIDTYDPERGQSKRFMNWVNFRLERTLIDCRRQYSDSQVESIPDLNVLDTIAQPEQESSLADEIIECIKTDIDQTFSETHIRDYPDANFREIALARFSGQSWEDISLALQIKVPTLSSFFQRCCTKFAPKFQEYL